LISVPVFLILAHRYELNPHAIIEQQRNLRIFKGDSAEISSRRSRLLVAFDGEVETMQSPLHYRARPGAARIRSGSDGRMMAIQLTRHCSLFSMCRPA
jgi:hypothetical protein